MPPLLEAASGNRLLVEKDDSDDDGEEGQYVIRTEALEEQCQACNLVLLLAEATGALFANYVPACLEALAPVAGSASGRGCQRRDPTRSCARRRQVPDHRQVARTGRRGARSGGTRMGLQATGWQEQRVALLVSAPMSALTVP